MPHPPICQLLLERHTQLLKPVAGGLNVRDRDGNVSESARLLVAVVVSDEVGVVLGAMVVSELDDTYKEAGMSKEYEAAGIAIVAE